MLQRSFKVLNLHIILQDKRIQDKRIQDKRFVEERILVIENLLKKGFYMKEMKRYISLDILRGLTVALMIIVNNPGSWTCIFPPLRHASWDGCTPTDLVFPFFLFCVGTSMAFAFSKYPSLTADALIKVLKRGVLIFLIGLGLNAFPFFPLSQDPSISFGQNWLHWLGGVRIFGVLQRIALCYVLASTLALWLRSSFKIAGAIIALSAFHVGLLLIFAGPEGAFTLEGCFSRRLDVALVGEGHVYQGYTFSDGTRAAFDPEGLLGVLTGTCTALLGLLAGRIVRSSQSTTALPSSSALPSLSAGKCHAKMTALPLECRLLAFSAALLILSQVLKIWIPVNKPLWSVSYVLLTAGWASLTLGILSFLVDRKGWEKPLLPFKAMGMNPLAIYVLAELTARTIQMVIGWDYGAIFGGNEWMSLLYAVLFMLVHMVVALVLYKKHIVIKL